MNRRPLPLAAALLATTLAAGCGGGSGGTAAAPGPDAFLAAVPTPSALAFRVELSGGGARKAEAGDETFATFAARSEVEQVQEATALLDRALDSVDGLVPDTTPAAIVMGEARAFGPVAACLVPDGAGGCVPGGAVEARLEVRQGSEAGRFKWDLQVRPAGATDQAAWRTVFAGRSKAGDVAHTGEGQAFLDLDAVAGAAPTFTGRGVLLAGFTSSSAGKTTLFRALRVGFDNAPPATLTVYGTREAGGPARVRVSRALDVLPGPRGGELSTTWLGWTAGAGGAAYSVISNWRPGQAWAGDVPWEAYPLERYYATRACFDGAGATVYREYAPCTAGQAPAACLAAGPATPVQGHIGDTWATACTFVPAGAQTAPPLATYDTPDVEEAEDDLPIPPSPPADEDEVFDD